MTHVEAVDGLVHTGARRDLPFVHEDAEQWIDQWLERRGASWRQLEAGQLDIPLPPKSDLFEIQTPVAAILLAMQWSDPAKWIECNLVNRHDAPFRAGQRLRLIEKQRWIATCKQDLLLKCASGVGKTAIGILGRTLHSFATTRTYNLTCANLDSSVDQIWDDLRHFAEHSAWLSHLAPKSNFKERPRRKVYGKHGGRIALQPVGTEGEALRNHHVTGILAADEAAMYQKDRIWGEMIRALKRGSQLIAASVPDGRTDRMFYKLSLSARRYEDLSPEERRGHAAKRAKKADDLDLVWIHLSKWDLPDDMWNKSEEKRWEILCRGRGTNLWKWNVDGEDGDPEEAVFSRALLQGSARYEPDYRMLRLAFDEKKRTIDVECFQANPSYGADETEDLIPTPNGARTEIHSHQADYASLIAAHLGRPTRAYYVGGGDFGYLSDPTELLISAVNGARLRIVARIELLRCPYSAQAQIIAVLDRHFGTCEHGIQQGLSHGWGFDATGVGTAAHSQVMELVPQPDQTSGWIWNRTTPKIDPRTLEPELDEQERQVTVSLKEQAVVLLEHRVQEGRLFLPYDRTILSELENYTSSVSSTGRRKFSTRHDHSVDALLAAELRLHHLEGGANLPSLASVAFETRSHRSSEMGIGGMQSRDLGLGSGGIGLGRHRGFGGGLS